MPLHLSKANQPDLLAAALSLTQSEGWHADAVAFAARRDPARPPCAIGVFQCFAGKEAEWHCAMAEGRVTRDVMTAFLSIAFHPRFLDLKRVFAPVAASNIAAQRAALASGFQFEFRKRGGAAGGEDAIVFSIAPPSGGLATARPQT